MASESKSGGKGKGKARAKPVHAEDDEDLAPEEMDRLLGERMTVAQKVFLVDSEEAGTSKEEADGLRTEVMEAIEKDLMLPYLEHLHLTAGWAKPAALVTKLQAGIDAELKKLDERDADAAENFGEVEVLDAAFARAAFYSRIGDKETAVRLYDNAPPKGQSTGRKIDVTLQLIRLGLFHNDHKLVKERIAKAHDLIEEGGDWDRKNRLKVYEGTFAMISRDFATAADKFLNSLATFNSHDMYPYPQFVYYTVLTAMQALDRVSLNAKVVESPDVKSAILDTPALAEFLRAFYECRYNDFFGALVEVEAGIRRDRYLAKHVVWFVREMRVAAYSQFLESYRSVTTESMATAFGVSSEFMDRELAKFIAAGRVNAKIDKVGGVIETNRPDMRNAQYQDVIKHGDVLLNRIQALSRALRV